MKTALERLEGLRKLSLSVACVCEFNNVALRAYTVGWLRHSESIDNPLFNPASVCYKTLPRPEMRRQAVETAYWRGAEDFNYYELLCMSD